MFLLEVYFTKEDTCPLVMVSPLASLKATRFSWKKAMGAVSISIPPPDGWVAA
jgi:hypothetical protein